MPKIRYVDGGFRTKWGRVVKQATDILDDYRGRGLLPISMRTLWYQMVARGHLANQRTVMLAFYRRMVEAREYGMVDWTDIVEEGRNVQGYRSYTHPADAIDPSEYRVDRWRGQAYRPEVWVEKAAQVSMVERACEPYRVTFAAWGGFSSATAIWRAAQRFEKQTLESLRGDPLPVVLYLGDHDPAGLRMDAEDLPKRLDTYSHGKAPEIRRVALTIDQIRQYNLPPNLVDPEKNARDTNYVWYRANTGQRLMWEMDALAPENLQALIEAAIEDLITDRAAWQRQADLEDLGREQIRKVVDQLREDVS